MTSICLGLCRHLVLKATDNFYYFDIKYNVKLEIQKQFFLQHNMERMIFKLLDHRGILFKILQFEGKKCTFGPIHSSSVWRNKSLTLTLIHRAIEAYVGPEVLFRKSVKICFFNKKGNGTKWKCWWLIVIFLMSLGREGCDHPRQPTPVQDPWLVLEQTEGREGRQVQPGNGQQLGQQAPWGFGTSQEDQGTQRTPTLLGVSWWWHWSKCFKVN